MLQEGDGLSRRLERLGGREERRLHLGGQLGRLVECGHLGLLLWQQLRECAHARVDRAAHWQQLCLGGCDQPLLLGHARLARRGEKHGPERIMPKVLRTVLRV